MNENRLRSGMLVFPNLTQLDLTGPYEVLVRLPRAETPAAVEEPRSGALGTRADDIADDDIHLLPAPRSDLRSGRGGGQPAPAAQLQAVARSAFEAKLTDIVGLYLDPPVAEKLIEAYLSTAARDAIGFSLMVLLLLLLPQGLFGKKEFQKV